MQNLFEFGTNNSSLVNVLLEYLEGYRPNGMCDYLETANVFEYESIGQWFKGQDVFTWTCLPVETAILKMQQDTKTDPVRLYYRASNVIDVSLPQGQLRRWWCYNLAIAASQHPEFE